MELTHQQRFDCVLSNDRLFAPLSHGCASMRFVTDYSAFKKSNEEKALVATHKANLPKTRVHKFKKVLHESF